MSNTDPPSPPGSTPVQPAPVAPLTLAVMPDASRDLESEVASRRTEIETRLRVLESDSGSNAAQERARLAARLSELAHLIKVNVVDGWANVGSMGKARLASWLAK